MNDDSKNTFSISMRLQRTISEFTFVSIPINDEVLVQHADGTKRVDVDKLTQQAIILGDLHSLEWHLEEQKVQLHPIQTAPPAK